MSLQKKVIWSEGMTLDPHHFQQWDRSFQGMLHSRIQSTAPFYWGVTHLDIDREALTNGHFNLKSCVGVMSDGLTFELETPIARNDFGQHFSATGEKLDVFLAIPARAARGA